MLLSIIIPTRNEEQYIKNCIESIYEQNFLKENEFEIIIADGDSTDSTLKIIKKIQLDFNNIFLIKNSKRYMPIGFNKGLSIARGKYILMLGAHSQIKEDFLKNALRIIKEKKCDCVSGILITKQKNFTGKIISKVQSSFFGVGGVKFRNENLKHGMYSDTGVFGLYNRKVFKLIGGLDEELIRNQDDEFNFRLIQNQGKIWVDPSIKTIYFARSTLSSLIKQYFQYGFYKVRVFQKRGGVASWRHLVPAFFVISIFLSFYVKNYSLILLYTILNCIFSIKELIFLKKISKFEMFKAIYLFPITYLMIHLSYGFGTIFGFVYFFSNWNNVQIVDTHFNKNKVNDK